MLRRPAQNKRTRNLPRVRGFERHRSAGSFPNPRLRLRHDLRSRQVPVAMRAMRAMRRCPACHCCGGGTWPKLDRTGVQTRANHEHKPEPVPQGGCASFFATRGWLICGFVRASAFAGSRASAFGRTRASQSHAEVGKWHNRDFVVVPANQYQQKGKNPGRLGAAGGNQPKPRIDGA